jgi:hypothetical protein
MRSADFVQSTDEVSPQNAQGPVPHPPDSKESESEQSSFELDVQMSADEPQHIPIEADKSFNMMAGFGWQGQAKPQNSPNQQQGPQKCEYEKDGLLSQLRAETNLD